MSSSLCLILFIVPLALSANNSIDSATLQNVFGNPPPAGPALAVTPSNGTLVDPDYWDSDDNYMPKFDFMLTKRLASSSSENFLLSPLGLKLALAILTEAATSTTQTELSSVLGFDLDRLVVRRKFAIIIDSLTSKSSQYILNLGNRIYVDDFVEPRQRFAAIAEEFYKTELKKIDFNDAPAAAKSINAWVANKTEGNIHNLVNEDDIQNVVVLILNTIYFKGTWRHQFAPNATKKGPFYVSASLQKPIFFMNVKDKFYYAESAKYDAKIVRMPYLGNKFAMYVIVPNSLTGLPRVLDGLSNLRDELNYLQEHVVDITLPRFKFDYTSSLDGVLKELGIRQAFEDTASFPGISRGQSLQQRLRITKVLQRSGIEVNELGSIAYSASEISLDNKFGGDSDMEQEVVANKPFMFFIQDEATRQLLFTGRVSDPSLSDGTFKSP
ncbi:serine protease inhibitor 27A-like [Hyposmocoma kahamanoa]|uniref:serine protease inhibitor 27A-like n=1 Tax=Hyposmocoma kahamanoa TaxID=1477025 RepID=UPI000E6D5FB2|nr:serine protease inhibitor 27A-like [Hyposmocoma kahamanoa]